MKAAALKPKLYVYAIVPRLDDRILGPIGLDTSTVHSITGGSLSAFVSEIAGRFRPERRHLAAHQEVLRQLMDVAPAVLPVAFGMVAEDGKVMHRILSRNQRSLREQLERVHGRVEMGLRVTWDVPNIFEYFVATHEELRVTRDRFFGGHREPMQDDKIEVGRLFDRLLREDRETHGARVEEILAPCCDDIKRNTTRGETEVFHLACLVQRDRKPAFEAAVFEAAKLFDNSYAFDYSGPWAPHNFVDLALDLRPGHAAAHAHG